MVSIWRTQPSRVARQEFDPIAWLTSTQWALGWAIVLMTLAIAGGIFLAQVSRTALAGRNAQLLNTQLNDVRIRNAVLEQNLARSQSLTELNARTSELESTYNMVTMEEIDKLTVVVLPPDAERAELRAPDIPPAAVEQVVWMWFQDRVPILGGASDTP